VGPDEAGTAGDEDAHAPVSQSQHPEPASERPGAAGARGAQAIDTREWSPSMSRWALAAPSRARPRPPCR
jgi:hypothetical protein